MCVGSAEMIMLIMLQAALYVKQTQFTVKRRIDNQRGAAI